jgi:hypothetical protein
MKELPQSEGHEKSVSRHGKRTRSNYGPDWSCSIREPCELGARLVGDGTHVLPEDIRAATLLFCSDRCGS